jgi:hypothetical protein
LLDSINGLDIVSLKKEDCSEMAGRSRSRRWRTESAKAVEQQAESRDRPRNYTRFFHAATGKPCRGRNIQGTQFIVATSVRSSSSPQQPVDYSPAASIHASGWRTARWRHGDEP